MISFAIPIPSHALAFQMGDRLNWPFHILFMVFFLVLGSVLLYLDLRRRRGFNRLAGELGFDFKRRPDDRLAVRLGLFEILREGGRAGVSHILSGTLDGYPCWAFNFFHRKSGPMAPIEGGYGCVLIRLAEPLPAFRIMPESIHKRLTNWDYERIFLAVNWPGDQWFILAKSLQPLQELLNEAICGWHQRHPDTLVAVEDDFLLIAWPGEIRPTNVQLQLDESRTLIALLTER